MIPNFPLFLNSAAFIPLSTLTLEPSSGSFKPQPVRNTMYTGVMSYVHVGRVPLCTSAGQRTASPSPFSHSNMAFLWTQTMSLGGKRPYLTGRRHVCLKLIVNYLGGGEHRTSQLVEIIYATLSKQREQPTRVPIQKSESFDKHKKDKGAMKLASLCCTRADPKSKEIEN